MDQRFLLEALQHFEPLLRSGLETQKWINYSNANWFRFFMETGQVKHRKVWQNYSEKIARHEDVIERIEILNLIDLIQRRGAAYPDEKDRLVRYIRDKALVFGVFSKPSGLSIHQTNMVLNRANQEALIKMNAEER